MKSAAWLIRDHALTVLPAVTSLNALRRVARPSAATVPRRLAEAFASFPESVALCKAPVMSNSIIVWDLETVPDLRGYAAANGISASTDDEVREAIGDKFPKHIYHSIVCISAPRPTDMRRAKRIHLTERKSN
jgi:hypothetical protein